MSETAIEIIVPFQEGEDDQLSHGLVTLTEAISQIDPDIVAHGFLGGEFGYGAQYDNTVFTMRPYYWGDCTCGAEQRSEAWHEANPHSPECYQTKLNAAQLAAGVQSSQKASGDYKTQSAARDAVYQKLCTEFGLSYPAGCAVHCSCGKGERAKAADIYHRPDCAVELPNFLYKPTGFEVRWYKYIGRDNETEGEIDDMAAMFQHCIASLSK